MPMYGQSFTLAYDSKPTWNEKSQGGAQAGPFTRARGFLAYYEVILEKNLLVPQYSHNNVLCIFLYIDLPLCEKQWLAGGA